MQLQKIGCAALIAGKSEKGPSMWSSFTDATLQLLIKFLISEGAVDFHSDDGEEDGDKVVLQHSFRSQLATDIVRELDESRGAGPIAKYSHRTGIQLSVSKAVKLLKFTDLSPLYQEEVVSTIAAQRKRPAVLDVVRDRENREVTDT